MDKLIQQKQLSQLISAQFKEIFRQPAVIFWGIIFPILMAMGLGIAFTQKTDIIRNVAVIDNASSDLSVKNSGSTITSMLENRAQKIPADKDKPQSYKITITDDKLGNTTFIFQKTTRKNAMVFLKRGLLNVIMEDRDGQIYYHFDPLNTDAQFTYLKLLNIFNHHKTDKIEAFKNIELLTVHGTRYIDFLVPGLMAMGIMMSCMWGMSYGMIDKRSKKLLRRMVATPMRKSHFLISLMTVRITMNLIESALLFLFAWLAFHITIQGSIAGLFAIFIAGNIAFGGIAIFVSSRTANTEIGNGLVNAVVMPMMVLSGVFFSYHNFPDWSIPFIQKLPLTLLADGLRSIFIEGAGYTEVILPAAILLCIGIFFFSAGLRFFKWH